MTISQIKGLHHVTSMASDAKDNNAFFTNVLGLRRIKQTVNFDAPDVYHLYYGDETGSPGSVMTYFPFPNIGIGRKGIGEVGTTAFSVPDGSLGFWQERLSALGVKRLERDEYFGKLRLRLSGPDGDGFALIEGADEGRAFHADPAIPQDVAIRGFHSTSLRLKEAQASAELLRFMGYEAIETRGDVTRMKIADGGNGADIIDIEVMPSANLAQQGGGSVHHIAFAVEDRAAQADVRRQLLDTGYQVTPVIDRDYFYAIYFRTPGGVLFEVATNEPGFTRDEELAELGTSLQLPKQHEHLREKLKTILPPLSD